MGYKVEAQFDHAGMKCVVVMTEMGHRCGYVGIPKGHQLHGIGYSKKVQILKTEDMENIATERAGLGQLLSCIAGKYREEYISPDMFFNVHGGITYSEGGNYPVDNPEGLWWFGYDCSHAGDARDLNAIDDEKIRSVMGRLQYDGVVRTLNYCIEECKRLAEQLDAINPLKEA